MTTNFSERVQGNWFRLGWFFLGISLIIYIISWFIGWGVESENWIGQSSAYCEMSRSGIIREPVNSISNLAFIIVGMYFLYTADKMDEKGSNPLMKKGFLLPLNGFVSMFLGICSFAVHGSSTPTAGILDWSSMLFWISFPVFYNLSRWLGWGEIQMIKMYLVVTTILLSGDLLFDSADFSEIGADSGVEVGLGALYRHFLWSSAIGFLIIFELAIHTKKRIIKHQLRIAIVSIIPSLILIISSSSIPLLLIITQCFIFTILSVVICNSSVLNIHRTISPWLFVGIGTFLIGMVLWQLGLSGLDTCNPDTILQFHSGFHIFIAVTIYSFGRYLQTETI